MSTSSGRLDALTVVLWVVLTVGVGFLVNCLMEVLAGGEVRLAPVTWSGVRLEEQRGFSQIEPGLAEILQGTCPCLEQPPFLLPRRLQHFDCFLLLSAPSPPLHPSLRALFWLRAAYGPTSLACARPTRGRSTSGKHAPWTSASPTPKRA